jgi:hypothetical protein
LTRDEDDPTTTIGGKKSSSSSATSRVQIDHVTEAHEGEYKCVVHNEVGTATDIVELQVLGE